MDVYLTCVYMIFKQMSWIFKVPIKLTNIFLKLTIYSCYGFLEINLTSNFHYESRLALGLSLDLS